MSNTNPVSHGAANWDDVADEVLAGVAENIEPVIKRTADDLYERMLCSVQDYLADNVKSNIASRIDASDRQARHDRERLTKVEAVNAALYDALNQCQAALAMLTAPDAIKATTTMHAWAAAVEAEAKARAALLLARPQSGEER